VPRRRQSGDLSGLRARPGPATSREEELNVIGTMQMLEACQKAAQPTTAVVKSSTAVYGAYRAGPAMFTEGSAAQGRSALMIRQEPTRSEA